MFNFPVIFDDNQKNIKPPGTRFFTPESVFFCEDAPDTLETLRHAVSRKPNDLISHSQRIYYSFIQKQPDHLYAALTDLLIVLRGKGQDFIKRMIGGSQSQLSPQQLALLEQALDPNHLHVLQTVKYSVFASGQLAESELITKQQPTMTDGDSADALTLAYDYIEYSQLDQAMDLLEQALFADDNEEIQHLLLKIYRSSNNRQRFSNVRAQAEKADRPLITEWQTLQHYFNDTVS